jgi:hypothetical protein
VDIARGEMVEKELNAMIERRSRKGEVDTDEFDPGYMESVRRYNARRREEMRAEWCEHHQGQAVRLRAVLEELIAHHEEQAAKLMEDQPKGAA